MAFDLDTVKHFAGVFRNAVDRGGIREAWEVLMRGLYRRLRSRMAVQTYASYNGVSVNIDRKALDEFVPSRWLPRDSGDVPTYESGLVAAIRENVRGGERVVIVGGGWGVTTVVAARATGKLGSVTTFEESAESVRRVEWAIEAARCSDVVGVLQYRVDGDQQTAGTGDSVPIKAENLPECDVLEMDCEGAELGILERMTIRPRLIIVESHGVFGSSSRKVRDTLVRLGYSIISTELAELHQQAVCRQQDIMVLVATSSPKVESERPASPFLGG